MILDVIQYAQSNGVLTKTVTSVSIVSDIDSEISALKAQVQSFSIPADDPADQVALDAAVLNYNDQILFLQGLS